MAPADPLDLFAPAVRTWFAGSFEAPTRPQQLGWPAIARGESTLILAPTGSGKTLTAFLWCLDRLLFQPAPPPSARCRVLYVSPLKALAVDVDRNLRAPLAGIVNVAAGQGTPVTVPRVAIRTGDTPPGERAQFLRHPADILITTPESLFLLLTSNARERLAWVDTVIIDEIHALVPTKRGAHLALSLERLEAVRQTRPAPPPLQRIGLSATQRPLDEVARFLGGLASAADPAVITDEATTIEAAVDEIEPAGPVTRHQWRPVTIVDASERKPIALRIEVPVEDMTALETTVEIRSGPASQGLTRPSIWSSIHPRLLDLVRQHRTTLLFVNSRRLAERLAGALNELSGELLVRSHHGSLAREARAEVEDLLKAGRIRALVATSSLELGIDMGAIDLVVQIEAPPSVASGLQRIGRAGHQVGATSAGVIFPKFRGDLLACAAVSRAMHEGKVESTRYPRNPLDVLAQQVVAMTAQATWSVDALFAQVRGAAPYAELSRRVFEGVLDMLSGRYPSDEFAELRPRVTWDRLTGALTAREGAARVAIANAGTIPDRGLYGVFLAGADKPQRVGELDEEMVFETQPGETFTLGASTWRIEEITHDRVLVSPAPGVPGKMPFWHGDRAGRPVELGYAIGGLVRELRALPRPAAIDQLVTRHDLDPVAADNLLGYLDDQAVAGGIPDDRTIVIERCLDELGDWRVCVLSPFGSRIHAPWSMAVVARIRATTGTDVEVMWGDEGFVVRFPGSDDPPDTALLLPDPEEVTPLVVRQLGSTSLFAARFRETAGRALLLPRRRPGKRTPLWQQRKRAADLLAVASRFGSFPIVLETYREILRDHFDMPALVDTLRKIQQRTLRVTTIDSRVPSPFAASLLFSYVANYIYDGDAPLAERRAQALSVDQAQLRELLGDAELRELLDPEAVSETERQLQLLDPKYRVRSADGIHDLLLRLGDLTIEAMLARCDGPGEAEVRALEGARRIVPLPIAGERRYVAVEDAARYRDALGTPLPSGLPEALLTPVRDAAGDLVRRYARTHGPFTVRDLAMRYGLGVSLAESLLLRLTDAGQLLEGEFRPGGHEREWIDADVLRRLRRRSLARLRREVEAVDPATLARFLVAWNGIGSGRRGLEALLDAIEQLQGAPLLASVLEAEILPARVHDFSPAMLDTLVAAGEVTWAGIEPNGDRDGRIALYLTDHAALLRAAPAVPDGLSPRAVAILEALHGGGAAFFGDLHLRSGGGYPGETVDALWELVWAGLITNDTLHPLRAYLQPGAGGAGRRARPGFRSRRLIPPTAEGRWSARPQADGITPTARAAAVTQQLLTRYGVLTREGAGSEGIPGGFSAVYPVLSSMEDAGRVRRGYFVEGLGGAQFALPGAVDLLRSLRDPSEPPRAVVLAATDTANPYGTLLRWPEGGGTRTAVRHDAVGGDQSAAREGTRGPTRVSGASVVLVEGALAAYLRRGERELLTFPPADPTRLASVVDVVARALLARAMARPEGRRGMLLAEIDASPALGHPWSDAFVAAGFARSGLGLQARGGTRIAVLQHGGATMAEQPEKIGQAGTPEQEHDRIRRSNDADQARERAGRRAPHNEGYDDAVRGSDERAGDGTSDHGPIDPDSAASDVERDDDVSRD